MVTIKRLVMRDQIEHEDTLEFGNIYKPSHFKVCRIQYLPLIIFQLKPQPLNITQLRIIQLRLLIISDNLSLLIPLTGDHLLELVVDINTEETVTEL